MFTFEFIVLFVYLLMLFFFGVNFTVAHTFACAFIHTPTLQGAQRTVTKSEAIAFARAHSMLYLETSAKTKVGVQQAFQELIQKV